MANRIAVGKTITAFKLEDQVGKEVTDKSCTGKKYLLSFHPLAWTGICTKQMQNLDAAYGEFESLGTVPFGLSVDAPPSKKAWAESMGLRRLQLLSDFWPHGGFAESLGIFRHNEGFSERANILVDENGKVIWAKVYEIAALPDFREILDFLKLKR